MTPFRLYVEASGVRYYLSARSIVEGDITVPHFCKDIRFAYTFRDDEDLKRIGLTVANFKKEYSVH